MTRKYEVEAFLESFKQKTKIWGLVVSDTREVNSRALEELELSPKKREEIITKLTISDYCQGPKKANYGSDVWIFGVKHRQKEIYIKLSLGASNSSTLCISFHIADYHMKYPFKN